jgi:hypothetical protein
LKAVRGRLKIWLNTVANKDYIERLKRWPASAGNAPASSRPPSTVS